MTDCLREPAFVVGEIDNEINFSLPPASGEEYIKRVIIEAQRCSDIVVADIDSRHFGQPTIDVEPLSGCVEAPPCLGPMLDWQQCQVLDFSNIRLHISQMKNEIQTAKRQWKPPQTNLPTIEDGKGWIQFCSGHNEGQKNVPSLNTVLCLNQPMVEQILEYLVEYIGTQKKLDYEVGQWLYALLVVLEMPLTPNMCSCLRSAARTCSIIRANSKNLEVHEIGALNLFICLVARYFRQLDMADP
ncbi:PREDICTED: gem-associated protein 2 [Dufourea novaeangliae]|uniref:Gem-associated protein 2 n=1 Tax=Dufourea novaeangliae TaxID=178035 RepID=A0A154PRR9_DUFNO|nr:PREDICTED: gem-associated protein 2 [Dufourea novaeangliae]KZC14591.1 Gem-associated protein 2 [Dufourea novaeangliae]